MKGLVAAALHASRVLSAIHPGNGKGVASPTGFAVKGTFEVNSDGVFYKFDEQINRDDVIG